MYRSVILSVLLCSNVLAHEMTPTYPKWQVSYIEGVQKTTMEMFNRRADVEWYEIGVFDEEWKKVPFAASPKLIRVQYLDKKIVEVYLHKKDKDQAYYICSKSKILSIVKDPSIIASRICSKIK